MALSGPICCVPPPVLFAPDQLSLAVQLVGLLVVVHVNVMEDPGLTDPTGLIISDTIGISGGSSTACTVTVAYPDPALFAHVKVYV